MNRKQRRAMNKYASSHASEKLAEKNFPVWQTTATMHGLSKEFDKQDKDMLQSWSVVVKQEVVRLFCPDCIQKQRRLWNMSVQRIDRSSVKKILDGYVYREHSVMIKFYGANCGYCHHLAPIYKKLADRYDDIHFYAFNMEDGDGFEENMIFMVFLPYVMFEPMVAILRLNFFLTPKPLILDPMVHGTLSKRLQILLKIRERRNNKWHHLKI